MKGFFRTLLLTIVWFSLLVAPLSFFQYICFSGLCNGPEVQKVRSHIYYPTIIGLYIWLYPIIVFMSLYYARKTRNKPTGSFFIILPLICLIPFSLIQLSLLKRDAKLSQDSGSYYQAHPEDYVCSAEVFIRYPANENPYLPKGYLLFLVKNTTKDVSREISYFATYEDIKLFLNQNSILIKQCKNAKGIVFHSLR
jgi:hypothetical protein